MEVATPTEVEEVVESDVTVVEEPPSVLEVEASKVEVKEELPIAPAQDERVAPVIEPYVFESTPFLQPWSLTLFSSLDIKEGTPEKPDVQHEVGSSIEVSNNLPIEVVPTAETVPPVPDIPNNTPENQIAPPPEPIDEAAAEADRQETYATMIRILEAARDGGRPALDMDETRLQVSTSIIYLS